MFDTKATGIKRSVKQSIRTKSRQIRHFHLKVIDINRKRSSDLLLRRFGEKKNSSDRFYWLVFMNRLTLHQEVAIDAIQWHPLLSRFFDI